MAKTSIHIEAAKQQSEVHNKREKDLDYVNKILTKQNEQYIAEPRTLAEIRQYIADDYYRHHGKKQQAKANPIREGVIVIEHKTSMAELRAFGEAVQKKWGIKLLQIYIHRDEGHIDDDTHKWICNNHAHILFDFYDYESHKLHRLLRNDLSEMQSLLAESLHMERGQNSDVKHLEAIQFKNKKQQEALEDKRQKLEDIITLTRTEVKRECHKLEKQGRSSLVTMNFLAHQEDMNEEEKNKYKAVQSELTVHPSQDQEWINHHNNLLITVAILADAITAKIKRIKSILNMPTRTLMPWNWNIAKREQELQSREKAFTDDLAAFEQEKDKLLKDNEQMKTELKQSQYDNIELRSIVQKNQRSTNKLINILSGYSGELLGSLQEEGIAQCIGDDAWKQCITLYKQKEKRRQMYREQEDNDLEEDNCLRM